MSTKKKAILLTYGEGGHAAQMLRLAKFLPAIESASYVVYSDDSKQFNGGDDYFPCLEIRDKHSKQSIFKTLQNIVRSFRGAVLPFSRYRVKLVISTGPGHVILPSAIARILGIKVIHIETWSRFETKSFTGRIMYWIANEFWVQNKSLLKLYPKSTYVGLL
ncbi:PssD/Cps14F family polysaccharide biosynthesis glycosyltransferase [Alteromonas facilis]|uniref:PssD/Cps14F family polysaccharide biosynthesis glycosyltransferase n=1 Tax=Alteromonas facilis TaxID=2048004 RepID=UPI000C28CCE0|nr:PssD/Cps14F family polysaccharide biosynthesis glycosyltransferase [Alteromonas facilis]